MYQSMFIIGIWPSRLSSVAQLDQRVFLPSCVSKNSDLQNNLYAPVISLINVRDNQDTRAFRQRDSPDMPCRSLAYIGIHRHTSAYIGINWHMVSSKKYFVPGPKSLLTSVRPFTAWKSRRSSSSSRRRRRRCTLLTK